MTQKFFSAKELYRLRNKIPISVLIEEVLNIPVRMTEGVFRFLCPVCGEFNTAVNPKTNLARCFCCEKNFNTIDLVMVVEKMNFVKAVHFLKTHVKGFQSQDCQKPEDHSQSPQHISDIVKSVMPSRPDHLEPSEDIPSRVLCIEQELEKIAHQLEIISKAIT